ncbi:MAG: hypothetical protein OEU68_18540, partial [Nitrospira sp.]|nr:hypothetical protein [Nitrospira sp.]
NCVGSFIVHQETSNRVDRYSAESINASTEVGAGCTTISCVCMCMHGGKEAALQSLTCPSPESMGGEDG